MAGMADSEIGSAAGGAAGGASAAGSGASGVGITGPATGDFSTPGAMITLMLASTVGAAVALFFLTKGDKFVINQRPV